MQKIKLKQTEIGKIPEDWKVNRLEKYANFITGKLDSNAAEMDGNFPFFTCAPEPLKINTPAFDCEALLLAGNNANGIFHLNYYSGKFNAYQRTYIITPKDKNKLNLRYLKYQLNLRLNYLKEISQGTATKFLTMRILNGLNVVLPIIEEQKAIAKILSDLDSKIELLQNQNQTLEKIGQALFKHWFVDFEFPNEQGKPYKSSGGEMVDSELGKIPKGWRIGMLGDLLELNIGGDWGNENEDNDLVPIIALRGVDIDKLKQNGFSEDAPTRWVKKSSIEKRDITDCDILVGGSGLGPIGKSIYCHSSIKRLYPTKISYSNFCKRYTAKNNFQAMYCEIIISNLYKQGLLKQYFIGTSIPNLDAKSLLNHKIIIPTNEVLNRFYQIINIKFEYIFNDQIQALKKIRDSLLPKLMSGKIRVPVELK